MKVRNAKKEDFKSYLEIKKESLKEYSKIAGCKINLTDNQIKKELIESINNPKRFLLIIEDREVVGYLIGSIIISGHEPYGYIDDVFIHKDFRGKSFGTSLINKFIKLLKQKKIKKLRLGVNIKNKKAIGLYKNLGFKIKHYEMDKEF